MATPSDPGKATARSPFAGCAIFICVGVMIIFLLVISVVTFYRQYNAIAKFTDEKPAVIEVTQLEGRDAAVNELTERLESFRQHLTDDKEATLALTADDLNTAIAAYEPLKDLRGTFRFISIGEKDLRIAISFPLNGKPRFTRDDEEGAFTTDRRHLNATLLAAPELFEGEVVLRISEIDVPGKTVAPEFIERMSPHRITERYKTDPVLGPAMLKLTGVEIKDGTVIFRRKDGEKITTTITNDEVDAASNRLFKFFGIGASLFLAFVGTVVFLGLRKKSGSA